MRSLEADITDSGACKHLVLHPYPTRRRNLLLR